MSNNTTPFPSRPLDPKDDPHNIYGYIPTLSICILFITLYSLSTIIHVGQSLYYRLWYMLPTAVLCGALETLGWSARAWSSGNADLVAPFTIQITMCIVGPTPLLAANFIIFGRIAQRLGSNYLRLTPKRYTIIFLVFDNIALSLQSVGGALASIAKSHEEAKPGGYIVLSGIVFQLAVITCFVAFAGEFFYRYFHERPIHHNPMFHRGPLEGRLKLMTGALAFNTLCLFIRAIYRTIELADGWDGRIIQTQVYFNVLDGGMITLALVTFNIMHPGFLLRPGQPEQITMKGFDIPSTARLA